MLDCIDTWQENHCAIWANIAKENRKLKNNAKLLLWRCVALEPMALPRMTFSTSGQCYERMFLHMGVRVSSTWLWAADENPLLTIGGLKRIIPIAVGHQTNRRLSANARSFTSISLRRRITSRCGGLHQREWSMCAWIRQYPVTIVITEKGSGPSSQPGDGSPSYSARSLSPEKPSVV